MEVNNVNNVNTHPLHCVICGNNTHKRIAKKSRLNEDKAIESFIKITRFFCDEVYNRTSHLDTVEKIRDTGILYHGNCMRNYTVKYDRIKSDSQINKRVCMSNENVDTNSNDDNESGPSNENHGFDSFDDSDSIDEQNNENANSTFKKNEAIQIIMDLNVDSIEAGNLFTLSELREQMNALNPKLPIENRDIKRYITRYYKKKMKISIPKEYNKSSIVYSSSITIDDLIHKLYARNSSNSIKEGANIIKQSLKNYDFDLNDSSGDAANLKDSGKKMKIPQPLLIFFSELYGIDANDFDEESLMAQLEKVENADLLQEKRKKDKVLLIKNMFNMMLYIFTDGKKKIPVPMTIESCLQSTCKKSQLKKKKKTT